MEEFLLEHGNIIVSGIITMVMLCLIMLFVWATAQMQVVAIGQTMGV